MSDTAPEQWWLLDEFSEMPPGWLRTPSPDTVPHFMRQTPAQSGHEHAAPSAPGSPPSAAAHALPPPLPHDEAYDRWDRTRADLRPFPSMEVVAGHAGKKFAYKIHDGDLRAFEMAHGIPSGMLNIARDSRGNPVGVRRADGMRWQPDRYRTPANLAPETLGVIAAISHQDANPTHAHRLWRSLPRQHRPAPNGKVVAGFVGKNVSKKTKRADVDDFADEYDIPRRDLVIVRNPRNRQVIGAALRPGAAWPPVAWGVPSVPGAAAGNPLGAATSHTLPGGGQRLAGPSPQPGPVQRGSASASSAPARPPSRPALGPQRGGRGM